MSRKRTTAIANAEYIDYIEKELCRIEAQLSADEDDLYELIQHKCRTGRRLTTREIIRIDRMLKAHEYDWTGLTDSSARD